MAKVSGTVTSAQKRLIEKLHVGFVIVEYECRGKLSYTTAQICNEHPHCYNWPEYVNKNTVWALLSIGLIKVDTAWPEHENPIKIYVSRF